MTTARFALPLLATAQAQKEVTHNEALTLLDALVQPVVVEGPTVALPANPASGQCWLVGTGAAGLWEGQDGRLALWTDGGWRFVSPINGMQVMRLADSKVLRWNGTGWAAPPQVTAPAGGSVIDVESRAAINSLITALSTLGWLDLP